MSRPAFPMSRAIRFGGGTDPHTTHPPPGGGAPQDASTGSVPDPVPPRRRFQVTSLRQRIMLLTGGVVTAVFLIVIILTTATSRAELRKSVLHDLSSRNQGYVHSVSSIFHDRATIIRAVRDDLELYDTRGQMWMHLAARTGEKVFDDTREGRIYEQSFLRKLIAYERNGQLSGERMTAQVRRMLALATAPGNAYGDGMKFFYIGVRSNNPDPVMREYDQYQDSSLWVPDARVDDPYTPLERPWYIAGQEAGRDRVVFTEPYAERRTKEALVSGGTAITVEGTVGTLAGGISIKPIMDSLLQSFNATDAQITVFSKGTSRGTRYVPTPPKYIYSSRDASLGENIRTYNDPQIVANPAHRDIMRLYDATRGRDHGVVEWTIDGDHRLVAFDTVPEVGWKLFTSVSWDRSMSGVAAAQTRNAVISFIGLTVLLGLIALLLTRALRPLGTIRGELVHIADTGDLGKRTSVRSRDEVGQMAAAINQMLDNTAGPVQALGHKVERIAQGDLRTDTSVTARGDIAKLVDSFNEMTRRLIELEATHRDASPLTGLPGGVTIELEVQRRLAAGAGFTFCMFDLDNFKPFNDRYGYGRGNLVLKQTARLLESVVSRVGAQDDFVGHIGGDDFVVLASADRFEGICRAALAEFDEMIPDFYDAADRKARGIDSLNRAGQAQTFPIMTITACAVPCGGTGPSDLIGVGEVAAALKHRGKKLGGSNLIIAGDDDGGG